MPLLRTLPRSFFRRKGLAHKVNLLSPNCEVFKFKSQQFEPAAMMSTDKRLGHVNFETEWEGPGRPPSNVPVRVNAQRSIQSWVGATSDIDTSDPVQLAKGIFFQGLQKVIPPKLIPSQVKVEGTILKLENDQKTTIDLSQYKRKYVVGFGKACLPMAETLAMILHSHIDRCIVSVPFGSRKCNNSEIEVYCGAENNIPDEDSFEAAKAIVELAQSCTKDDLLIVLISGGGSALLPYPNPPVTLQEKKELIKKLSKAGCTINELNTVRKRLSLVKGGGLVQLCKADQIVSLIISDVLGSPLDIISSGPTVENFDSSHAAMDVLEKYGLQGELPNSIQEVLSRLPGARNRANFDRVTNFVIGDNKIAIEAAATAATQYGLQPFVVTTKMFGEAAEVGYDLANMADAFAYCINHTSGPTYSLTDDPNIKSQSESIQNVFRKNGWSTDRIFPEIFKEHDKSSNGICLLFGGETTVTVRGTGLGGRNQELALSASVRLDLSKNLLHVRDKVAILSAGTDGFDGPNTAAGAVVDTSTVQNSQIHGFSPITYLKENDSFNFFQKVEQGKYHIVCGHTETNVMDLVIIVILKNSNKDLRQKSML